MYDSKGSRITIERLDVSVSGGLLAVERSGSIDHSPMVFVHGYALRSSGELYKPLLQQLAKHYCVYAIDLRGHGNSAKTIVPWTLDQLADDVLTVVAALSLDSPFYVGHSIGGFIGLKAAARAPGAFKALCLLTPAVSIGARNAPAEVGDTFINHGRDPGVMRAAFAPMYLSGSQDAAAKAADAATLVHPTVHESFFAEFARTDITEQLEDVSDPVFYLIGGRDVVVSPEVQHLDAARLKACKEVRLGGGGHMLPIEHGEFAAREIRSFLDLDLSLLRSL